MTIEPTKEVTAMRLHEIIARLSPDSRRFILAASKRVKPWNTIRRDAKILPSRRVLQVRYPVALVSHPKGRRYETALTELGLQVKAELLIRQRGV